MPIERLEAASSPALGPDSLQSVGNPESAQTDTRPLSTISAAQRVLLPEPVARIYSAVAELEATYPGRKFTPDGHLVGSIGEVVAAEALGLTLHPASFPGHDAIDATGRQVQIKLTRGTSVSLYSSCDRLVVLRIISPQEAEIAYDGDGALAWSLAGPIQKNGQRAVRLAKLANVAITTPRT